VLPAAGNDKLSDYFRDQLERALLETGRVRLVERGQLDRLVQEIGVELTLASDETARSLGNRLGADVMVLGKITDVGNAYNVLLRAIAVTEHVILGIGEARIDKSDADVQSITGIEYVPPGKWRRIGAWTLLVTGVLAGGAGFAFSRLAMSAQDDADRAATPTALQDANQAVVAHGRTSLALYAGAGAAAVTSLILFLTSPGSDEAALERAWRPSLFADRTGFGVAFEGTLP
jgi:hypothetical protein